MYYVGVGKQQVDISGNINYNGGINLLCGISGKARSGKNTVALPFIQAGFKCIALADKVKEIARDLFGWDGKKDEKGRNLLIAIGMLGRQIDPDVWIKYAMEKIKTGEHVVIPDIRFKNEASWIKAHKGVLIRVVRPALEKLDMDEWRKSKSEIDLDCWEDWDYIIVEDDYKMLQEKAKDIRHKVFGKRYGKLQKVIVKTLQDEIAEELKGI